MSLDKLVDSTQLDSDLTSVANAIRAKSGGSASLAFPAGFVSEIQAIPGGGETYDFGDHAYPQGAITTNVTELLGFTFRYRTGITSISAPNCTKLNNYVFAACTALRSVSLPVCSALATSNNFDGCTALEGIVLPAIANNPSGAQFNGCSALAYADFGPNLGYWNGNDFFKNCSSLTTIILRKSALCKLNNISYLAGTPFASGGSGGILYVPKALIDNNTYTSATNWSTILGYANNQIKAIEGSYYETHWADGTPIT